MANEQQIRKEIEILLSEMEGESAMRVLLAFQCIRCGRIMDDIRQAKEHSIYKPCQNEIRDAKSR